MNVVEINQSTFYFHDAKERIWKTAKDELVIESAASYCIQLTIQKLTNATINKS